MIGFTFFNKVADFGLSGSVRVDSDKSISHRALMLSAISEGEVNIFDLLKSEDVLATMNCLKMLGCSIEEQKQKVVVKGVGLRGFVSPDGILDMGNSGTSARLMLGLLAGCNLRATLSGDDTLIKRPMARVCEPLAKMGVSFEFCGDGMSLPLTILSEAEELTGIVYDNIFRSAQVKSAIIIAGLKAKGKTIIIEKDASRNHTEIMLRDFGVEVIKEKDKIIVVPPRMLMHISGNIFVPADISSAAFLIASALIVKNSKITLRDVGLNETRIGFLNVLQRMNADIEIKHNNGVVDGYISNEKLGDITVRYSKLVGCKVLPEEVPTLIDELPILAVLASFAKGDSLFYGLGELKVKESNRFVKIIEGLKSCGVDVENGDDWIKIKGSGGDMIRGGALIDTGFDHRIAMSYLILSLGAKDGIFVNEVKSIMTSFPNFFSLMATLGVDYAQLFCINF